MELLADWQQLSLTSQVYSFVVFTIVLCFFFGDRSYR